MVGSLCCSRKYLIPVTILYTYKSQIKARMEYCGNIWAGASQSSLISFDSVQNHYTAMWVMNLISTVQLVSHETL